MSEGKLRAEADRGARAAALLKNDMLVEAFETLEERYAEAWRSSPMRDNEAREYFYMLTTALNALRQQITTVVETGKLAEHQLHNPNKK